MMQLGIKDVDLSMHHLSVLYIQKCPCTSKHLAAPCLPIPFYVLIYVQDLAQSIKSYYLNTMCCFGTVAMVMWTTLLNIQAQECGLTNLGSPSASLYSLPLLTWFNVYSVASSVERHLTSSAVLKCEGHIKTDTKSNDAMFLNVPTVFQI